MQPNDSKDIPQAWPEQVLRRFLQPLADWIREVPERRRNAYFAEAADLADLQRRIDRWDRHRGDPLLRLP